MNQTHHPAIPYEHTCWLQSTAESFNVSLIFPRENALALNKAFCLRYEYWNCCSNLYPAFLVCSRITNITLFSHQHILVETSGASEIVCEDNMYVNHHKFRRNIYYSRHMICFSPIKLHTILLAFNAKTVQFQQYQPKHWFTLRNNSNSSNGRKNNCSALSLSKEKHDNGTVLKHLQTLMLHMVSYFNMNIYLLIKPTEYYISDWKQQQKNQPKP